MRALKFAVIAMGVLIIGATIALVVLVVQRVSGPGGAAASAVSAVLDEPPGTRIASAAASNDWMVLQLQGGGVDRVVVLDPRSGRVLSRVALSR